VVGGWGGAEPNPTNPPTATKPGATKAAATNKEHFTQEGIQKLLVIKSYMNKGLSPELKLASLACLHLLRWLCLHHILISNLSK
jgi:hypothetical protein